MIIGLCSASGCGKTTLLNYIKDNYKDVITEELSGRDFLDAAKGSYDEQMTDQIQSMIALNNIIETGNSFIKEATEEPLRVICYSRTVLDTIVYAHVLKRAEYLIPLQLKWLNYIKEKMIFVYLAKEWPLDANDTIRGTSEVVREECDVTLKRLLNENEVNYYTISGDRKQREERLDDLFWVLNIQKQ